MASGLSSASTLAQIEAAYDDNATYAEADSAEKCRAFIVACRLLLRRLFTTQVKGANSLSYDPANLRHEIEEAKAWLLEHGEADDVQADPRVTRADFRNFRE